MSYILDALVKADLERQRQEVPGLHTVYATLSPRGSMYRRWGGGIAGLLLAAGLLFLVWGRLGPGQAPAAALTPGQMGQLPASPRPSGPPPALVAAVQAAPAGAAMPARPVAPAREASPGSRVETVAEERKSRPDSRLYPIAELPPALQKEARNLTVAGFAQASDAGEPMAIINDRAWREGDEVAAGLKVERISKEGVIFNLRGYRFRKGAA